MRGRIKIQYLVAILCCTVVICISRVSAGARADSYPTRPITLVVPFPAGGGVDVVARIVADRLAAALGQPIIIDNRAGAAGVVGTRFAAHAAPDGYTLVIADTGTVAINPTLYANPGYDALKDFAPVGLISSTPIVLMAHPSFPAQTVAELIALAKKDPGKINIGAPPAGTSSYLTAEMFNAAAGVTTQIVTFRGTAQLTGDLYAGHILVGFNVLAPAIGAIGARQIRLIAVASSTRSDVFPEVPTVMESGLPGFEAAIRYGLLAPAGTGREIVDRLNRELYAVLAQPSVRERITADGGNPLSSTPDEYTQDISREAARWGPLIKKLNLKVE